MSWLLLSVAQGCNDGWTGFQGSCYLYIPDVYTWFDAKVIVCYLNKRGGGRGLIGVYLYIADVYTWFDAKVIGCQLPE